MFEWEKKTIKADTYDQHTKSIVRGVVSPKEIIMSPQGRQIETIISALTKVVAEMITDKEETLKSIESLKLKLQGVDRIKENESQTSMNLE